MTFQRFPTILIILFLLAGMVLPVSAGIKDSREYEIKAAFLVQFSKYISWPAHCFAEQDTPIIIGIFGRDPFGSTIDKISGSFTAHGRKVEVHRLHNLSNAERYHILYIASDKSEQMAEINTLLAGKPITLVSDSADFLKLGGTIHFITVGTKIRFNISVANSRKNGLEISSKLLSIAHEVE